jgi:DNA-directed RNA polymerase specialized sigma24 family protein
MHGGHAERATASRLEQPSAPRRSIDMLASCIAASVSPHAPAHAHGEAVRQADALAAAEAAFRDVLAESLAGLELCDRNLIRFHYFHGLAGDQLAELCCRPRTTVVRQLGRIRARMMRDIRRGLRARLPLAKPELARLLDLADRRFDRALAQLLRA